MFLLGLEKFQNYPERIKQLKNILGDYYYGKGNYGQGIHMFISGNNYAKVI